jgi:hypothetical protein
MNGEERRMLREAPWSSAENSWFQFFCRRLYRNIVVQVALMSPSVSTCVRGGQIFDGCKTVLGLASPSATFFATATPTASAAKYLS